MNISIEIGGPLAEAINNLAAALVSAKQADTVIEKASTKARAKKPEVAPEPDPTHAPTPSAPQQDTPPSETASTTPVSASPSSAPEPENPFTQKDLHTEILRVARKKGHDAASAILAQFGARKISEVKEADLAAAIKATKAL